MWADSESEGEKKPDFVFAIFATKRARPELLEKAAKENVLAYNVNWQSKIDLENNCIWHVWTSVKGNWVPLMKAPLPDVVYDFAVHKSVGKNRQRTRERKELARELKKILHERKIPFINPPEALEAVNNKNLFAKVMHEHQVAHPQTRTYKKSNLKKMLAKHDLFIKPEKGSKGAGIIEVKRTRKSRFYLRNHYSLHYKVRKDKKWVPVQEEDVSQWKIVDNLMEARANLKRKNIPYIIQNAIEPFLYEDENGVSQTTDFRINLNRNGKGNLVNAGIMMRLGGNLSQGGWPADYREKLKPLAESTGSTVEILADRIVQVAMDAHEALEQNAGQAIGDLGFDVLLTKQGEAYVIEANDKSGYLINYIKDPVRAAKLGPVCDLCKDIDLRHGGAILEYARYLVSQNSL